MAAVSAMGVPEDSPFRNAKQIPYPKPPPPFTQNLAHVVDEDNQSMRALVEEINAHD